MTAHARLLTALAAAAGCAAAHAADPGAQPQAKRSAEPPVLGRLFFTPAERAELDILRRSKPAAPVAQAEAPPPPPPPQVVTYGGLVRRSDGKAMLWINNRLVEEKEALAGLNLRGKVRPDGAVTLQVPDTGRNIEVKVGQSVEVHSGRVAETRKPRPEPPDGETAPAAPSGVEAPAQPAAQKPPAAPAADAAPPAAQRSDPAPRSASK